MQGVEKVGSAVWELAREALDGLPGGRGLNLAHEALDRHLARGRGDVVALRCVAPGRRPGGSALVGVDRVVERPWAIDRMLAVRPVVRLTLSADHRATDGATGARFLAAVDQLSQDARVRIDEDDYPALATVKSAVAFVVARAG